MSVSHRFSISLNLSTTMSSSIIDWVDFSQKNKPQGNSLAGGIFVMLVSGMQVGWIINNDLLSFPWARGEASYQVIMTYVIFYLAAMVGLYLAAAVVDRLTKKNIYFSAMTFVTFGSLGFIAMPRSIFIMMVARALIGFGHGYAYLVIIIHASEVMTQKLRGMIVASFNFVIISSVMVCGVFTMSFEKDRHAFGAMQWTGIVGLIYSVMGFIFIPIFTRESPVSLIRLKKYDQAVVLMCQLRHESSETWSIKNEYNELKAMVEEDELTSPDILQDRNIRPLLLISLLKVGSVLGFNFGLNLVRLKYATMFVSNDGTNYAVIAWMSIRMIAAMFTLFTIDAKGRKAHFIVSYGGSSAILIIMGIVTAIHSTANLSWLMGLLHVCFEIVSGFGIGMISDVYASEAFGTIKKPKSIMFTAGVEFLLHAVLVGATYKAVSTSSQSNFDWIFMAGSGILILVITVFLHKELPETAKMSIRQTRTEFLKSGEIVFSGSKMPTQNITFD